MTAVTRCVGCCFSLLLALFGSLLAACLCFASPPQQPVPSPQLSIPEVKIQAESGDHSAQMQLWEFLAKADPASPGFDLAITWLRSVALQNKPEAQFLLGYLYEHGKGLPLDYSKAADNYRRAAVQGYPPAENNLGSLYHYGKGLPQDKALAFHWYQASALHGNPAAQQNLGTFFYLGYGTPTDFMEAVKWFRAAADQGFAVSESNLAYCYLKGVGVPRDYSQAAYWGRLAAEQGHARAAALLGYLYEHGEGLPLDYVAAYAWYTRALAGGESSNGDRLKSLAQVMTRRQIKEANTLVSAQSGSPEDGSVPAIRTLLPEP